MTMTATERTIFLEALEKVDPADRAAFLDRACGGKADLRRRVEGLLKALDEAGTFMSAPAAGVGALDELAVATGGEPVPPLGPRPILEGPGTRIGPYKLLQPIGEGGMGVVYMAEQEQPVR